MITINLLKIHIQFLEIFEQQFQYLCLFHTFFYKKFLSQQLFFFLIQRPFSFYEQRLFRVIKQCRRFIRFLAFTLFIPRKDFNIIQGLPYFELLK